MNNENCKNYIQLNIVGINFFSSWFEGRVLQKGLELEQLDDVEEWKIKLENHPANNHRMSRKKCVFSSEWIIKISEHPPHPPKSFFTLIPRTNLVISATRAFFLVGMEKNRRRKKMSVNFWGGLGIQKVMLWGLGKTLSILRRDTNTIKQYIKENRKFRLFDNKKMENQETRE